MPENTKSTVWGVIFVVNLAPVESLSLEDRKRDWENKRTSFKELQDDVYTLSNYETVKPGFIVNELELDRAYCQASVIVLQKEQDTDGYREELLNEPAEINIGDPDALASLLNMLVQQLKADKYLLFTWDHGFGSGIFSKHIGASMSLMANQPYAMKMQAFKHFKNSLNGMDNGLEFFEQGYEVKRLSAIDMDRIFNVADGKFPDVLTNSELAKAIGKTGFPGNKLEVIAMMNCAMQMVDTGFALRNVTKYLVAAQTSIWWFGYHYKYIMRLLHEHPETSSQDLAVFVLQSERKKMSEDLHSYVYHSSLSAIDCAIATQIADAFLVLLNTMREYWNEKPFLKSIIDSRALLRNLSCIGAEALGHFNNPPLSYSLKDDKAPNYAYIDFFSFIALLAANLPAKYSPVFAQCQELLLLKKKLVIAVSDPPNFYRQPMTNLQAQFSATGVSVFFPSSKREINTSGDIKFIRDTFYPRLDGQTKLQTHFDEFTTWSKWLEQYLTITSVL